MLSVNVISDEKYPVYLRSPFATAHLIVDWQNVKVNESIFIEQSRKDIKKFDIKR